MKSAAPKAILAAYMLFMLFVSLRPGPKPLLGVWNIDKVYHFLAYAVTGFLWAWALMGRAFFKRAGSAPGRAVAAAFIISMLFGVLMEVIQYFIPSRQADVFDAAANTLGAFVGAVVVWWAFKAWGRGRYSVKTQDNR